MIKRKTILEIGVILYLVLHIISIFAFEDIKLLGTLFIIVFVVITLISLLSKYTMKDYLLFLMITLLIALNVYVSNTITQNTVKYYLLIVFIILLYRSRMYGYFEEGVTKNLFLVLVCIVFLISFFYGSADDGVIKGRYSSIFHEPSIFGMYILAIFLYLNEKKIAPIYVFLIYTVLAFFVFKTGLLSLVLAIVLSVIIYYMSIIVEERDFKKISLISIVVIFFSYGAYVNYAKIDKLDTVVEYYDKYGFEEGNLGRLSKEHGETNISGVVRLLHWANIIIEYQNSSIKNKLFGSGADKVKNSFARALKPHNDYLRILYEFGFIFFMIFFYFLWKSFWQLHGIDRIKISVLAIYIFAENLFDTFPLALMTAIFIVSKLNYTRNEIILYKVINK